MKVDVEGAEKMVLEGARNSLKECIIKNILMELINLNLNIYDESVESVVNFLKPFGYEPYVLDSASKDLRPFEKKDYDVIHNVYFKSV